MVGGYGPRIHLAILAHITNRQVEWASKGYGGGKMAKSLFLADSSTKLIFQEDDRLPILAGLIREYLGTDCEELFYCVLEEENAKAKNVHLIANEDDGYEQIADRYLAVLRDVLDALDDILLFFDESRLNRRKVHKALQRCRDNLYRNL